MEGLDFFHDKYTLNQVSSSEVNNVEHACYMQVNFPPLWMAKKGSQAGKKVMNLFILYPVHAGACAAEQFFWGGQILEVKNIARQC